jgi:hypothetical protein
MKEKDTYIVWEMKEGKKTKVKIGNEIFALEKETEPQKNKSGWLRKCPDCKETKPLSEYYILKKTGKPSYLCKECQKKTNRDYHAEKRKKKQEALEQKPPKEYKAPEGYKMVYAEVKESKIAEYIEKIKEKMPGITDADFLFKETSTGPGHKTIYVRRIEKKVMQTMNSKPEIGIVDATQEDVLPLVDSNSVIDDQIDEKAKKWRLFRKNH